MKFFVIAAAIGLVGWSPMLNAEEAAQIANPASEHCVKIGGRLEVRNKAGGQAGYCHLPDGRVVEEWALFRKARKETPR